MNDKPEIKILGAPLGFWGFVGGLTLLFGFIFSVPWWLGAVCLAGWSGLCAIVGWVGGEWRDK